MVGGLRPPVAEEDEKAKEAQDKSGIYFILEDADLQVGKVGKVCSRWLRNQWHRNSPHMRASNAISRNLLASCKSICDRRTAPTFTSTVITCKNESCTQNLFALLGQTQLCLLPYNGS
jgi:hypothetical protein